MNDNTINKLNDIDKNHPQVLIVEPFYGGSHKQLIDVLEKHIHDINLVTLGPKKWHWRARCGALVLSEAIPHISCEQILFCSSVLNLGELLGIRPDLQKLKKIVYFHENQLVFPVRAIKDRDIQYPYNQIITCLAADIILFNSNYNKTSFIENIRKVLKLLPDYKPKHVQEKIEPKCRVLYLPICFPKNIVSKRSDILHIVWPHRWEFDKNPESFINVLFRLKAEGFCFKVSILGETFQEVPTIFNEAKEKLQEEIVNFGYKESKEDFYEVLCQCHVVVSTADHEFFGVSVLEAVYSLCFPLLPNRLVYPEIYPKECLYDNEEQLLERLKIFCTNSEKCVEARKNLNINFEQFSEETLVPEYLKMFDLKQ